jgi:hypothetical protein
MPTLRTAARDRLRPRAVNSFLLQDIPEGWEVELHTDCDEHLTLGAKLNRMVARSRADYFVLLDDDDWHDRRRVLRQVEELVTCNADYSGTSKIYYFEERTGQAYLYDGNGDWLGGLAFTREIWQRCKFLDKTKGVDYLWQKMCGGISSDICDPRLFVASIHAENTCPKYTASEHWKKLPSLSALPAGFLSTFSEAAAASA